MMRIDKEQNLRQWIYKGAKMMTAQNFTELANSTALNENNARMPTANDYRQLCF